MTENESDKSRSAGPLRRYLHVWVSAVVSAISYFMFVSDMI